MNSKRFYILLLAMALYAPLANANDTTPFQCERLTIAKTGSWVAPILRDFCEQQEASNGQAMAKILASRVLLRRSTCFPATRLLKPNAQDWHA
jgi:hypothetical protein